MSDHFSIGDHLPYIPIMRPLHGRTSYWLRRGIFVDLRSFADFERRTNAIVEEKDRGDIFEIFIEGYLATQKITQHTKHWVVGKIPLSLREKYNLPRDPTGIDGIYETQDGSQIAYQVKYRQSGSLTYAEVAPFLGLTEKFTDRVIFTNAAKLSGKALSRTRWVSGDVFRDLSRAAFAEIEAWIKAEPIRAERRQPDPRFQVQALSAIKGTLTKNDRATVVMACGTGKTLVALWAAEQLKPKTVIVFVPSLTLLQQTLREWSEQTSWGNRFSYICVCSDKTVVGEDAMLTDTAEVGFRVDTDPKIVHQFLQQKSNGIKVIFSTYQSSPVVGKGARGLPPIDFAILDEAHKTTGLSGSAFGFALSDKNIRISKRLFLTATPRHIDIRHRDKEGEFRVSSMDDETVYGSRAYTLSFSAAAKLGVICRYKVIISLINKEMVDDFTRKHGITLVKRDEVSARWMANLIAIDQAIEKVRARKIITFHSRVRLAKEFATNEPRGIAYHLKGYDVRHVNGAQSSADRSDTIRAFANAKNAILTNARCLTEGIDIPAVDMVAFVDPRQSRIDIAQAVGRTMRKPRVKNTQKKVGYVVVPLFAGMGENDALDDAINTEKFDAVADILNALQEHDNELIDIIREIRQRKGEGKLFNPKRLEAKVEVIGPRISFERLARSIFVAIGDRLGRSWDEMYGQLIVYKSEFGDTIVPRSFPNKRLSKWAQHQRNFARKGILQIERRRLLEEIEFNFDPGATRWLEAFDDLCQFKDSWGHTNINSKDKKRPLARWVVKQRVAYRSGRLDKWKIEKLKSIGFEFERAQFDRRQSEFVSFERARQLARAAGIETPRQYFDWARGNTSRRYGAFPAGMPRSPQQVYKGIGWTGWNKFLRTPDRTNRASSDWSARLAEYKSYIRSLLSKGREASRPSPQLSRWMITQRVWRKLGKLQLDRKLQLDEAGFDWDPNTTLWEQGFNHLLLFVEKYKYSRVPQSYIAEDGFQLGRWVHRQRMAADRLTREQKRRLNELGFVWKVS